jgi:hypothetical protein
MDHFHFFRNIFGLQPFLIVDGPLDNVYVGLHNLHKNYIMYLILYVGYVDFYVV